MSRLNESTPELLKCRRFAGSCGATYVHSPVARVEHELDNSLLLGAQTIGDYKLVVSAQTFKRAHATIDASDHFPLTLEADSRRDFITVAQNRPRGLLLREQTFQVLVADLTAAMPKGF